jgi:hypothetical protein
MENIQSNFLVPLYLYLVQKYALTLIFEKWLCCLRILHSLLVILIIEVVDDHMIEVCIHSISKFPRLYVFLLIVNLLFY